MINIIKQDLKESIDICQFVKNKSDLPYRFESDLIENFPPTLKVLLLSTSPSTSNTLGVPSEL